MIQDRENCSTDGVNGGQNSESNLTQLKSEENPGKSDDKMEFSGKNDDFSKNSEPEPSKLGVSQELTLSYLCDNSKLGQNPSDNDRRLLNFSDKVKGKVVVSEDQNNHNQDENRWIERDFLQLSENSSKREIEDDGIRGMNRGDKKPKLETLDLSLALPDTSMSLAASNRVQDGDPSVSLKPSRSLQSLGRSNSNNTLTTFSNDFTTGSMSYSYSHQFSHNPSCSMTRNSTENYENSMGSHHRRDCDQIWNGGEGTNGSVHSRFRPVGDGGVALVQGNRSNSENNLSFFPSELPARMKVDTQSGDSRGRGSDNTKGFESLDFGRSRRVSRPERILREIVSESIQTMAQIIQELPDETFESTKEYLKKLISVPEMRDELVGLQLRLERRSDLTSETLSKAHKNQVLLLVSIRTGLESFLSVQNHHPTIELIEIFLFERCKNVNCKRLLPVEDCDCKICSTKKGFCSECMCPVCLNFDCASNTCSWVGCDVCSHWCHAACSIQKNLIKPGPSLKGPTGTTEMQFNCLCCGHASEMYGFIKDVFKSCAEQWNSDTFIKELDCVRKIFRGSGDFKGRKLYLTAGEFVTKLESKVMSPSDVCIAILQFFNTMDANVSSEYPISMSSLKDPMSASNPNQQLYNMGSSSGMNKTIIEDEWSVKPTKKDAFDSVESLVRIKEAEARMFQNKAYEARIEAEGYKRMMRAKIEKLDEEYTERISKLNVHEIEEERKKKEKEFKASETDRLEYYKMKLRMQAEIAGLLERMEKTKQQWV